MFLTFIDIMVCYMLMPIMLTYRILEMCDDWHLNDRLDLIILNSMISSCLITIEVTMTSLIANIFTAFLILLGVFYIYARYQLNYWKRRGILSPPAHFIFGNFKDVVLLRSSPNKILTELYNYGGDSPVVGFYIFLKPYLLIKSPNILKSVLIKDFDVFCDRHFSGNAKRDIVGTQNLFSMNNPAWKHARSKISPALTSGKLKKMIPLMIQTAQTMRDYIDVQLTDRDSSKLMKIKDISSKYTTDIVSSLAFGVKTNSFQTPEPEFRTWGRSIFKRSIRGALNLFVIFFFPEFADLIRTSMLGDSEKFFREVFWNSINTREKSGTKRGDFIDSLIQLKNEEQHPDFKFTGDYLFAHAAIFFLAGHESSSLTMSMTLLELAEQPELQKRVCSDIKEQFEKHGVTLEAFQEMKYLNQAVSETLRKYPPAPILDRVANKDYQIPDTEIVIEKGTGVTIPLLGFHTDPKYFPDPAKYDPDRFSEERKKAIPAMTYMPFGEGPRFCIGQRIGLLQTTIGLAMILSEYEVSPVSGIKNDIDERSIFLQPRNDIQLNLKRINSDTTNL